MALEDRITPYVLSGYSWADPNVSASFMPDGTEMLGGYTSSLLALLNATIPTETWQHEFTRALQTWAQYTPLNFRIVPDGGTSQYEIGLPQGDSRHGDIRLGARLTSTNVLGVAKFPGEGSIAKGDIYLNSALTYRIGSGIDLYSVLVHEAGHTLGMDHSGIPGTVMYGGSNGVETGLTADDIAGIQAIYGTRQQDAYDSAASNNSLGSATALPLSSGSVNFRADLTSQADVDYYRVVASGSSLTVSADARNLSLLAPKVLVYDANGNLLGSASAGYGQMATLNLTGLTAGQSYYLVADGATGDVFGMGAYVLDARFDGSSTVTPPQAPGGLAATAASSTQINLAWADSSSNEDGFHIERSTDGVNFTLAGTAGANATSYAVGGLAAGTTYYFRVRAYNGGGDSAWSNTAQATTQTSTPAAPLAPSGLIATAVSSGRIDVTWQDNSSDEGGFRIESSADGVTFAPAGTTGANVVSYSVTGLGAGTTYYFRVRAYNGGGDSAWSNTAQAATPPVEVPPGLTPDRFEVNDTAANARYLGKFNGTSQTALTVHSAADVDWLAFTASSSGTFKVSIAFKNAAGNLDLYFYDAQIQQVAGAVSVADNETVTVSLSGGKRYYLRVVSPDGGVNAYDVAVAKVSGKTSGGGGGGNLVLGDPGFDSPVTVDGTAFGGPLPGCGCPMCTGAAAPSPVADGGGDQSQDRVSPSLEFVPVADEPGQPESPGRTLAGPASAGWPQAIRLLAELDLPFGDGPALPAWAAGNRA